MTATSSWICRLLAWLGVYPKGCPGKPPAVVIGSDKAKISLSQKRKPRP